MGENICFIIGNGFNHLIKEICNTSLKNCEENLKNNINNNFKNSEKIEGIFESEQGDFDTLLELIEIKKFLDNIITLCNKHAELFKNFKGYLTENNINIGTDEKIIQIITTFGKIKPNNTVEEVYELFSNIGYTKGESIILIYGVLKYFVIMLNIKACKSVSELYSHGIDIRTKDVGLEFLNMEKNGEYRRFCKFFDENGSFGESLRSLIPENSNLHIYTTNYDGLLNYLFVDNGNYILNDGFSNHYGYLKEEYRDYYSKREPYWFLYYYKVSSTKNLCIPLHGTHKFVLKDGKTYKIKKDIPKDTSKLKPVMVFGNPDKKLELINDDFVLKHYFEIFKESLQNCSKLVIFGNSLKSDPHIVEAILTNFDEKKELIIVDYDESCCNSVKDRLNQNIRYNIKFKETENIKTTDKLLDLFEELIKN